MTLFIIVGAVGLVIVLISLVFGEIFDFLDGAVSATALTANPPTQSTASTAAQSLRIIEISLRAQLPHGAARALDTRRPDRVPTIANPSQTRPWGGPILRT
jgi:hypothetical protein